MSDPDDSPLSGPALLSCLKARARAEQWLRRYFADHDFVEVHTRARVEAPGTDVHIDPVPSGEQWLITSPEFQHKRLLALGVPRLFELARCFRAGELGPWHQPEFTLLEWYRAEALVEEVMADTEQLVCGLVELGNGRMSRDGIELRVQAPFQRMTVEQAFLEFASVGNVVELAAEQEAKYFQLWVDSVEPGLARLPAPVFVTDFPVSQAALARPNPTQPEFAERFELFALGVELCNGYGELTDAVEQRRRFEADNERRRAAGREVLPIDEGLLAALSQMPDTAGNALGLERLLALCLGTTLKSMAPFPALRLPT